MLFHSSANLFSTLVPLFILNIVAQDFEAHLEIFIDDVNVDAKNINDTIINIPQYYNDDYTESNKLTSWHSVIISNVIEKKAISISIAEIVSETTPQQCLVSENVSNNQSFQVVNGLCLSEKNSTCQVCIPGFTTTLRPKCEPCREGYHKTNYGIDQCTPCAVGWSTLGLKGQAYCWPCNPGSSTMGLYGQPTCTLCAFNSQATDVGSKGCMCLPGTALDHSGTLCIPCEPGYRDIYFNEVEREIPGSGVIVPPKIYCVACDPGKVSEIHRAADCIPCLPGTFASSYGQSQCISCPINTFSSYQQATNCDPCLHGSYTLSNKSVSCMCPAGTVKSNETADSCLPCDRGKYQPYNESESLYLECFKCESGTYNAHIGSSVCVDCPVGTYEPEMGSPQCQECGRYFYTKVPKSTSSQDCKCIAGTVKFASTCIPCPPAFYQNLPDKSDCIACPVYTTSLINGSTACDSCVPGSIVSNSGTQQCVLCRPGFYQPTSMNQAKCLQCPSGSFSGFEGATECTLCVANSYASFDGSSECLPCPVYSETGGSVGSSRCSCSLGYVASVTDTCVPCLPGYFQLDHGGMCKACAAGTYTPNPASHGPLACLLCEIGTFASSSGQSSCRLCHPNSENIQRGSAMCFCIMGMGLSNSNNNSECVWCTPGYYQPTLSLYCSACPAGYFNNQSKSSHCSQCALGMYSASPASVGCLECKGGSETNLNQTGCICPGGSQVFNQSYPIIDDNNLSSVLWKCSPCTPYCKYGETFMAQQCSSNQNTVCQACQIECPTGKYITSNCTANKDITCTSCSVGCKVGSFMSVPCTKYSNMICSQCTQACPTQRFAIASICTFGKDLTCVLCPPGSYASKTDGTIGGCIQCPPGYITIINNNVSTGIGDNSCTPCPRAMFSNPSQTQCIIACLPSMYPASKNSCGNCPPFTEGDGSGCVAIENNDQNGHIPDICEPDYKF